MELKTVDMLADAEGLVVVIKRRSQSLRALGEIKTITVPLKDRRFCREIAQERIYLPIRSHGNRKPADLLNISLIDVGSGCGSDQLRPQADAQGWNPFLNCSANDRLFDF